MNEGRLLTSIGGKSCNALMQYIIYMKWIAIQILSYIKSTLKNSLYSSKKIPQEMSVIKFAGRDLNFMICYGLLTCVQRSKKLPIIRQFQLFA